MSNQFTLAIPVLFLFALLASCTEQPTKHEEKETWFPNPAIPPSSTPPSEALQYIHDTDQEDRAVLDEQDILEMLKRDSPKMDSISIRDSLRYVLLWDLHSRGLIRSPQDKYNAGVVFTHSGGARIGDDTLSWHLAEKYLVEASQEGDSALRKRSLNFLEYVKYRFKPKTKGLNFEFDTIPYR